MTVLIIPAFPAMGKSYFIREHLPYTKQILDSDSSLFKWEYGKEPGVRQVSPSFPNNYLNYVNYWYYGLQRYQSMNIIGLEGISGIIFTSSHQEVLKGLNRCGLPYLAIIPDDMFHVIPRLATLNDSELYSRIINNYTKYVNDIKINANHYLQTDKTINELVESGKLNKIVKRYNKNV